MRADRAAARADSYPFSRVPLRTEPVEVLGRTNRASTRSLKAAAMRGDGSILLMGAGAIGRLITLAVALGGADHVAERRESRGGAEDCL